MSNISPEIAYYIEMIRCGMMIVGAIILCILTVKTFRNLDKETEKREDNNENRM